MDHSERLTIKIQEERRKNPPKNQGDVGQEAVSSELRVLSRIVLSYRDAGHRNRCNLICCAASIVEIYERLHKNFCKGE